MLPLLRVLLACVAANKAVAAGAVASASLPLLFMEPADLVDTWGKQSVVAPDLRNLTAELCPGCHLSHPALQYLVSGGLLSPNPRRPSAGMELFFASSSVVSILTTAELAQIESRELQPEWAKSIFYTTTLDFVSFTPAIRVASINRLVVNGSAPAWLAPHNCLAKSIARSHDGGRYVMLTTCADEGIRPMVADGPLGLDSFSTQQLYPAFWDHDVFVAGFSAGSTEVVDLQITFQDQNHTAGWGGAGLKYCDNVGLTNCKMGYRRVVTLRSSHDGLVWSNRQAWCAHVSIFKCFDFTRVGMNTLHCDYGIS